MADRIFVPHELKTIEVDVEKKIFRINGEDFGKDCTGFTIGCEAGEEDFFSICMRIRTDVRYVNYDESGKLRSDRTIEMHGRRKEGGEIKVGRENVFQKKTDLQIIRAENELALKIYADGYVPISDYKIQSSANGETELCVTFKGIPNELDLKASLRQ